MACEGLRPVIGTPKPFDGAKAMNSYPIFLAPGIAGPGYLFNLLATRLSLYRLLPFQTSDLFQYFRNSAGHQRQHDFEVHHSNVSFAAKLETRAHDRQREFTILPLQFAWEIIHDQEGIMAE